MNKIVKLFAPAILFAAICSMSACKKSFDQPPGPSDANIVANSTIATLKALHTVPGAYDIISSDIIISGIITANDKSGNLYKQLFIQDTTGAMQVLIEASSLYGTYPVGRRIAVRCKGLCLTDYHGTMELGSLTYDSPGVPSVAGILPGVVGDYIVGGSINNPVVPIPVILTDLGTDMQNKYINALITLDGYEFVPADTINVYADTSAYKNTVNRLIKSCNSSTTVIVRNSGYANFAALKLPKGNGSITSIYTIYKSSPTSSFVDKQLLIRDTTDIQFNGDRCGSAPPPPGSHISIAQLRAMYTGSNIKITGTTSIGGVVISDAANKNISSGSVIIQDGSAGISIYFGGTITYNVGDSIVLNVTNDSLLNYRGSLEVKTAFNTTPPGAVATGRVVTPQVVTVDALNTALSTPLGSATNIEYTLVRIFGATASGGTTYTGNRTLNDGTASITLYTTSAALFGASTLPSSAMTWTGYANTYNSTKEFQIRNLTDVQ